MKFKKDIPNFERFKQCLEYIIKVEKEIALITNKLQTHETKWKQLL